MAANLAEAIGWPATNQSLRSRVRVVSAVLKEATAVIVRNHYLHRGRTMAQIAYWITLDTRRVGVILFSYPRLSVHFHGYHPMELLELARLWIEPSAQATTVDSEGNVHAGSLASCAIGKALRTIGGDWRAKYPRLPIPRAIVSWSDVSRHVGTVYLAANFREVGLSGGDGHGAGPRRNGGRYQANPDYRHLKRAFIYELRGPTSSKANRPLSEVLAMSL